MRSQRCLSFVAATVLGVCGLATGVSAQVQQVFAASAGSEVVVILTAEQLDQLLGSIALYPDPLIAQILPASTYPLDVVKAARLVRDGASWAQIDVQDWDPSVRAVAHYPSVIEMMDSNLDWMQQLGQAFLVQPEDVMQSNHLKRDSERSLGNLTSTAQAQVLFENASMRIVPTDPEIIYVPVYQPTVVYYQRPAVGTYISFGSGCATGRWLDMDCDWHHRWFCRPGWTWNHWRDHVVTDCDRVVSVHRNYETHCVERPRSVWHRGSSRPQFSQGRPMSRPTDSDRSRWRASLDQEQRSQRLVAEPRPQQPQQPLIDEARQTTRVFTPIQRRNEQDRFRGRDNRTGERREPEVAAATPIVPSVRNGNPTPIAAIPAPGTQPRQTRREAPIAMPPRQVSQAPVQAPAAAPPRISMPQAPIAAPQPTRAAPAAPRPVATAPNPQGPVKTGPSSRAEARPIPPRYNASRKNEEEGRTGRR